ncbi:AfsR/SARP family transcriptional regulator [Streptomyces olivaceoviridis]|uniref:AfsR/SARP family transcriptional regulator n=1 Tax=Streptomyces olivaceoviridis TaxID=1921 RepID=UPI0036AF25A8
MIRAWHGETELDVGTPQQQAVLAHLLLRGGNPVPLEGLVAAIWGTEAPPTGPAVVRTYISRLRRTFPVQMGRSARSAYILPTHDLDLTELEKQRDLARRAHRKGDAHTQARALRSALKLWKGSPLTGAKGDFVERERARLCEFRLAMVEDLAAADLAAGRHADVPESLTELIAEQPLRERAHELLMHALYRSGRQAEALQVFTDVWRLLDRELGLAPGPGLRRMQQLILTSDPVLFAAEGLSRK